MGGSQGKRAQRTGKGAAKKLPGKIAKRWKKAATKAQAEDDAWAAIDEKRKGEKEKAKLAHKAKKTKETEDHSQGAEVKDDI
jgi:hypothetical protein